MTKKDALINRLERFIKPAPSATYTDGQGNLVAEDRPASYSWNPGPQPRNFPRYI